MRIVLVNDFYNPFQVGGAESAVRSLALGFKERGHSVFVITAHIDGTNSVQIIEGINVYRIGSFPAFRRSLRLASGTTPMRSPRKMINEFKELLQQVSPDVIHFHNVWLLGIEILKVSGYRKGITFHDYWPFCLRRSLIRVNGKPCSSPGKIPCRLCQLRAPATLKGLDILHTDQRQRELETALATCHFFTAPSQFAANQISNFNRLKVQVIHNCITPVEVSLKRSVENPYVLYASRGTRVKGYDLILRAFSRADMKHYHLKVSSNVPPSNLLNVEVLGWQSPENIAKLISQATSVVVPSLWPENSPMVILESLNYGIPVIASRIGGIPELISDGETGLLFEAGDLESIVAAVKRCFDDEKLHQSAHHSGPRFVRDHFSRDRILSEWETLYAH
jgi:glycosyltransferase involved in cell wall biosynthesis